MLNKIFYYLRYKKEYFIFPKITVKDSSNIAMIISISIAIILLLTIVTSGILGVTFKAYPGYRSLIEGLTIKIGGLIFGPIIGCFIGAMTDFLCILLSAGMFQLGYFITSVMYGFLAGIIKIILIDTCKKNLLKNSFFSICILLFVLLLTILYIIPQPVDPLLDGFGGKIIGSIQIVLTKNQLI
jgi:LytS/YehU family sensor histidine kinase